MKFVMVLNDGETYTNLRGCTIVAIDGEMDMEVFEQALDAHMSGAPEDVTGLMTVTTFDGDDGFES